MNDDQVLHALHFDDSYEVKSVLADGPGGLTELVFLGDVGPFVRKKMSEKMASRGVWSALSECECRRLPQVVATYELPDYFVVVYDYVPGETLESLVAQRGRLSVDAARGFAFDVCEAAEALHSRNIVHRDITPANIIVAADGAHLMDLGIARFRVEGASKDTEKLGTFGFASPEQFGFAQTDARSDVYSIGRLLGYMLTGVRPDDEGYEAALGDQAKVLSAYRAVVDKASAFEPSSRYQSAAELAEALRVAAAGGNPASAAGVAAGAAAGAGGAVAGVAVAAGAAVASAANVANAGEASADVSATKPGSPTAASPSQQTPQAEISNENQSVNLQRNTSEGQPSKPRRGGISNTKKLVIAILFILVVGLFIMIFLAYFLGHAANSASSGAETQTPAATKTQDVGSSTGSSGNSSGSSSTNGAANPHSSETSSSAGSSIAATSADQGRSSSNVAAADTGLTVVESGWSCNSSGYVTYVYALRNDSANTISLPQVKVAGKSSDGSVLFSREDGAMGINPGETQYCYNVESSGSVPATVEFTPLAPSSYNISKTGNAGSASVSNVAISQGQYGRTQVTGEVKVDALSTLSYAGNQIRLVVVLRDADGNIVGGAVDFITSPGQGGKSTFSIALNGVPEYETAEVYACPW